MRLLSPKVHGIIDYLVVVFLWLSPSLFGLTGFTATFIYVLGAIHLALTLITDFEMGAIKMIPLRIHGMIELVVAIFLFVSPWIFGVSEEVLNRNFLMGFGVAVLAVFVLTDYQRKGITT